MTPGFESKISASKSGSEYCISILVKDFSMKKQITALFFLFVSVSVHANNVSLVAVPTGWKLQNYVVENVVIWYSGSACTNGRLSFDGNASVNDKNRLWSLIMAAKISGASVEVYYEDSLAPTDCTITSFSLIPE